MPVWIVQIPALDTENITDNWLLSDSLISINFRGWKTGSLFKNRAAIIFARRTVNPWERCLMQSPTSSPVYLARVDPILLSWRTVYLCQAARVYIGRGRNVNLDILHPSQCLFCSSSVHISWWEHESVWKGQMVAVTFNADRTSMEAKLKKRLY